MAVTVKITNKRILAILNSMLLDARPDAERLRNNLKMIIGKKVDVAKFREIVAAIKESTGAEAKDEEKGQENPLGKYAENAKELEKIAGYVAAAALFGDVDEKYGAAITIGGGEKPPKGESSIEGYKGERAGEREKEEHKENQLEMTIDFGKHSAFHPTRAFNYYTKLTYTIDPNGNSATARFTKTPREEDLMKTLKMMQSQEFKNIYVKDNDPSIPLLKRLCSANGPFKNLSLTVGGTQFYKPAAKEGVGRQQDEQKQPEPAGGGRGGPANQP